MKDVEGGEEDNKSKMEAMRLFDVCGNEHRVELIKDNFLLT